MGETRSQSLAERIQVGIGKTLLIETDGGRYFA